MANKKRLLPALQERKRYIGYEVFAKKDVSPALVKEAIVSTFRQLFGDFGLAQAGLLWVTLDTPLRNKGIVRVDHASLDHLRAAFSFIRGTREEPFLVKSISASGIVAKVQQRLAHV